MATKSYKKSKKMAKKSRRGSRKYKPTIMVKPGVFKGCGARKVLNVKTQRCVSRKSELGKQIMKTREHLLKMLKTE